MLMPLIVLEKAPTYQDVFPIFLNKCGSCHNGSMPGKNWLIYEDAFTYRIKIQYTVETEKMPPFGKLSASEKTLILEWVKNGGNK